MSSQGSPTLDLDVRSRRLERCVALTLVMLATTAPLLLDQAWAIASVTALATGLFTILALWRAGWLGTHHRLGRIVWLNDGRWFLSDYRGNCIEATACSDCRRGRGYIWLRWRGEKRYSLLLGKGDVSPTELRRLLVRLAIDRLDGPVSPLATTIAAPLQATLGASLLARLSTISLLRFASAQLGEWRNLRATRRS